MKTLSKIALFNCLCLGIAYSSNQNDQQDPFVSCLNAVQEAVQSSIQNLKQQMDQTISLKDTTIAEKGSVIVQLQHQLEKQKARYDKDVRQKESQIDQLE